MRRLTFRSSCTVVSRIALLAGLLAGSLYSSSATAVEVMWGFDSAPANDTAAFPTVYTNYTTTMKYFNGATTGSTVAFGTASSFGLPAVPGGNVTVMHFPAFSNTQGLALQNLGPGGSMPGGGPGGGIAINQYTLAWDVFFPSITNSGYTALYQTTSPDNSDDAELFIKNTGGIGISGNYPTDVSTFQANAWHRITVSVDLAAVDESSAPIPTMKKFVDGVKVGQQTLGSATDNRFSLLPDLFIDNPVPGVGLTTAEPNAAAFILTDNDDETSEGYISSFYYTDHVVDDVTIAAWGGAKAGGIPGPGDVNFDGVVNIFDINFVSANWNTTGPSGDANHDGTVNIFDINLISSNWRPTGGGNSTAVPEPSTCILLALGAIGMAAVARTRHSRNRA